MEDAPKYTDLDAESSRKYTNLDSYQSHNTPAGAPNQSYPPPSHNPAYHMNSSYYPPANMSQSGHSQDPNAYYNGMMPPPAHAYPNGGYAYPVAPSEQSPGYPPQHAPPQSFAVHPQQQTSVSPQYISQMHSEIEYYKSEVSKMYVMPPSSDLAAKIRDFQNRISFLEEKRQFLTVSSGPQPAAHAPPAQQMQYQHSPPRYPNQVDPNYVRMNYNPNPRMPTYSARQPTVNQYYQNQPPPNSAYMSDNSKVSAGYQSYPQNYQMPPPQPHLNSAGASRNMYPQPGAAAPVSSYQNSVQQPGGGYLMAQPGYQSAPQTSNVQSLPIPDKNLSRPIPGKSPNEKQPRSSVPVSASNDAGTSATQVPVSVQRNDTHQNGTSEVRASLSSGKSEADDVNTMNDSPAVSLPSQATSLVSSFVQSAFKTKDDASDSEVMNTDVPAGTAVSVSVKSEAETTDSSITVPTAAPCSSSIPQCSNSDAPKSEIECPSLQESKPSESEVDFQDDSIAIPSFEPCESLIKMKTGNSSETGILKSETCAPKIESFAPTEEFITKHNSSSVDDQPPIKGPIDSQNLQHTATSQSFTELTQAGAPPASVPYSSTQNPMPPPPHFTPVQVPQQVVMPQHSMATSMPCVGPMMAPRGTMPPDYSQQPPGPYPVPPPQSMYNRAMPPSMPQQARPPQPGMYGAPWMPPPVNGAPPPPHWMPPPHGPPTGYPAIAPAGPLPPTRHQMPPRAGKKSSGGRNASAEGKRIKKKRKDTEEAVPDSTTSEFGEPVTSSNDITLNAEFGVNENGSPPEEPSSSQGDSIATVSTKSKKRNDGTKKRKYTKRRTVDSNEAEGIDVSSSRLASLEMSAPVIDTANSNAETTIELPSPSQPAENLPKKPRRLATKIGASKKKRRRFNSSDEDIMLPPEELNLPPEELIEKRRSERNTG